MLVLLGSGFLSAIAILFAIGCVAPHLYLAQPIGEHVLESQATTL